MTLWHGVEAKHMQAILIESSRVLEDCGLSAVFLCEHTGTC